MYAPSHNSHVGIEWCCRWPLLVMGNRYITKYPTDTNLRAVVRYLANKPDHGKRLAVAKRLKTQYLAGIELVSSRKRYKKQ